MVFLWFFQMWFNIQKLESPPFVFPDSPGSRMIQPCRLQHGRRFQAPSPVFRHAAARGAAAQGRLEAEDEGQLAKLGDKNNNKTMIMGITTSFIGLIWDYTNYIYIVLWD